MLSAEVVVRKRFAGCHEGEGVALARRQLVPRGRLPLHASLRVNMIIARDSLVPVSGDLGGDFRGATASSLWEFSSGRSIGNIRGQQTRTPLRVFAV